MKQQLRYFQFPLCLLTGVYKGKDQGMQDILKFALVKFALSQEITKEDAARQLIYDTFCGNDVLAAAKTAFKENRGKNWLPKEDPGLNQLNEIDRYMFFSHNEERENLVWEIIELFRQDNSLLQAAITHTQLSKINQFFNVKGPKHDQRLRQFNEVNEKIKAHELRFNADPKPTIETELFFDFMNNDDMDPMLFAAYIAIRSIIGRRKYCKTTKEAIRQRMFGAKNNTVFEHLLNKEKAINELNEKTSRSEKSQRYWLDKMIKKLQDRKLITKIGIKRRLYLSCILSYEKLAQIIMKEDQQSTSKNDEKKAIQMIKKGAGSGAGNGAAKGAGSGAAIITELFNN